MLFDQSALDAAIAEFHSLYHSLGLTWNDLPFQVTELGQHFILARSEVTTTGGAKEVKIFFEPSDLFCSYLAALKAGNFKGLRIEGDHFVLPFLETRRGEESSKPETKINARILNKSMTDIANELTAKLGGG